MADEEETTALGYAIMGLKVRTRGTSPSTSSSGRYAFAFSSSIAHYSLIMQILFAFSPLLALGAVLMSAFETEDQEDSKRKKKGDFEMDGHGE
jgi:hypothetical protein